MKMIYQKAIREVVINKSIETIRVAIHLIEETVLPTIFAREEIPE